MGFVELARNLRDTVDTARSDPNTTFTLNADHLTALIQINSLFRLYEQRAEATNFRLSSEVLNIMAKVPLGAMQTRATGTDVGILEKYYNKLRQGGFDNSFTLYEKNKFRTPEDIAKELVKGSFRQAVKLFDEMSQDESLSVGMRREAAYRLLDSRRALLKVDDVFDSPESDGGLRSFADINSKTDTQVGDRTLEVAKYLSKNLLPSDSIRSAGAEVGVLVAVQEAESRMEEAGSDQGASADRLENLHNLASIAVAANRGLQTSSPLVASLSATSNVDVLRAIVKAEANPYMVNTGVDSRNIGSRIVAAATDRVTMRTAVIGATYTETRMMGAGVMASAGRALFGRVRQDTLDDMQQVQVATNLLSRTPDNAILQQMVDEHAAAHAGQVLWTPEQIQQIANNAGKRLKARGATQAEIDQQKKTITNHLTEAAELGRTSLKQPIELGTSKHPYAIRLVSGKGAKANYEITGDVTDAEFRLRLPKAMKRAQRKGGKLFVVFQNNGGDAAARTKYQEQVDAAIAKFNSKDPANPHVYVDDGNGVVPLIEQVVHTPTASRLSALQMAANDGTMAFGDFPGGGRIFSHRPGKTQTVEDIVNGDRTASTVSVRVKKDETNRILEANRPKPKTRPVVYAKAWRDSGKRLGAKAGFQTEDYNRLAPKVAPLQAKRADLQAQLDEKNDDLEKTEAAMNRLSRRQKVPENHPGMQRVQKLKGEVKDLQAQMDKLNTELYPLEAEQKQNLAEMRQTARDTVEAMDMGLYQLDTRKEKLVRTLAAIKESDKEAVKKTEQAIAQAGSLTAEDDGNAAIEAGMPQSFVDAVASGKPVARVRVAVKPATVAYAFTQVMTARIEQYGDLFGPDQVGNLLSDFEAAAQKWAQLKPLAGLTPAQAESRIRRLMAGFINDHVPDNDIRNALLADMGDVWQELLVQAAPGRWELNPDFAAMDGVANALTDPSISPEVPLFLAVPYGQEAYYEGLLSRMRRSRSWSDVRFPTVLSVVSYSADERYEQGRAHKAERQAATKLSMPKELTGHKSFQVRHPIKAKYMVLTTLVVIVALAIFGWFALPMFLATGQVAAALSAGWHGLWGLIVVALPSAPTGAAAVQATAATGSVPFWVTLGHWWVALSFKGTLLWWKGLILHGPLTTPLLFMGFMTLNSQVGKRLFGIAMPSAKDQAKAISGQMTTKPQMGQPGAGGLYSSLVTAALTFGIPLLLGKILGMDLIQLALAPLASVIVSNISMTGAPAVSEAITKAAPSLSARLGRISDAAHVAIGKMVESVRKAGRAVMARARLMIASKPVQNGFRYGVVPLAGTGVVATVAYGAILLHMAPLAPALFAGAIVLWLLVGYYRSDAFRNHAVLYIGGAVVLGTGLIAPAIVTLGVGVFVGIALWSFMFHDRGIETIFKSTGNETVSTGNTNLAVNPVLPKPEVTEAEKTGARRPVTIQLNPPQGTTISARELKKYEVHWTEVGASRGGVLRWHTNASGQLVAETSMHLRPGAQYHFFLRTKHGADKKAARSWIRMIPGDFETELNVTARDGFDVTARMQTSRTPIARTIITGAAAAPVTISAGGTATTSTAQQMTQRVSGTPVARTIASANSTDAVFREVPIEFIPSDNFRATGEVDYEDFGISYYPVGKPHQKQWVPLEYRDAKTAKGPMPDVSGMQIGQRFWYAAHPKLQVGQPYVFEIHFTKVTHNNADPHNPIKTREPFFIGNLQTIQARVRLGEHTRLAPGADPHQLQVTADRAPVPQRPSEVQVFHAPAPVTRGTPPASSTFGTVGTASGWTFTGTSHAPSPLAQVSGGHTATTAAQVTSHNAAPNTYGTSVHTGVSGHTGTSATTAALGAVSVTQTPVVPIDGSRPQGWTGSPEAEQSEPFIGPVQPLAVGAQGTLSGSVRGTPVTGAPLASDSTMNHRTSNPQRVEGRKTASRRVWIVLGVALVVIGLWSPAVLRLALVVGLAFGARWIYRLPAVNSFMTSLNRGRRGKVILASVIVIALGVGVVLLAPHGALAIVHGAVVHRTGLLITTAIFAGFWFRGLWLAPAIARIAAFRTRRREAAVAREAEIARAQEALIPKDYIRFNLKPVRLILDKEKNIFINLEDVFATHSLHRLYVRLHRPGDDPETTGILIPVQQFKSVNAETFYFAKSEALPVETNYEANLVLTDPLDNESVFPMPSSITGLSSSLGRKVAPTNNSTQESLVVALRKTVGEVANDKVRRQAENDRQASRQRRNRWIMTGSIILLLGGIVAAAAYGAPVGVVETGAGMAQQAVEISNAAGQQEAHRIAYGLLSVVSLSVIASLVIPKFRGESPDPGSRRLLSQAEGAAA